MVAKASWVDLRKVIHPVSTSGGDEHDPGCLAGGPRTPDRPRLRAGSGRGGRPCRGGRLRVLEWHHVAAEARLEAGSALALLGCPVSLESLEFLV